MEKNIKELLKCLKIEMLAVWLIVLGVFLAGEFGVLPYGLLAADKQTVFVHYLVVDTTGLLCALIGLLTTLICWPTEEKIKKHLESHDNPA